MRRGLLVFLAAMLGGVLSLAPGSSAGEAKPQGFVLVVMDPLAAPLSCPCVEGYAQRNYELLAKHLERELGRPVQIEFDESLVVAMKKKTAGQAHLIIGKDSVVRHDASRAKLAVRKVAGLAGKDGLTTQTGLIVVPAKDPAKSVADLQGYRIIFGPAECDEKHAAAIALLKKHAVSVPAKLDTCASCSDGALEIIEKGPAAKNAAVISSYAAPLLEGCGNIQKGDLRVIGTTEPVAFISAFVNEQLSASDQDALLSALGKVAEKAELLQALETKTGFVIDPAAPTAKKK